MTAHPLSVRILSELLDRVPGVSAPQAGYSARRRSDGTYHAMVFWETSASKGSVSVLGRETATGATPLEAEQGLLARVQALPLVGRCA